jgi:hypothetical protein
MSDFVGLLVLRGDTDVIDHRTPLRTSRLDRQHRSVGHDQRNRDVNAVLANVPSDDFRASDRLCPMRGQMTDVIGVVPLVLDNPHDGFVPSVLFCPFLSFLFVVKACGPIATYGPFDPHVTKG